MSFFTLFDHFLTFELSLSATTKEWKESIRFQNAELYGGFFERKIIENIKYSGESPDPDFVGVPISSQIISFRCRFWTFADNAGKPKLVDSKQKN